MKQSWLKAVFPIALIFSFRMLGLFMLIPVFTIVASDLKGATPALIGFALGSYGLTQGLLQIPFGMLSDRVGRKPIITLGLSLFALGSLIGALSHSIYTMIFARCLQGAGAIGSVLIALLADLTSTEQRTRAMAVIGMTIGLSFSLAMVLSPILASWGGLSSIFYLTMVLALLGLVLLHGFIPTPKKERFHADSEVKRSLFKTVLKNPSLQPLNIGICLQHFILTSTFYAIPILLKQQMQQGQLSQQWHFYLPLILLAFVVMLPLIIFAEKKHRVRFVFLGATLLTAITQCCLIFVSQSWLLLWMMMFLYFVAFNLLEAMLPSLISKLTTPNTKGTALGVYSTSQFLGIFFGGTFAGLLYQHQGHSAIFIANAALALCWFIMASRRTPNSL